MNYPLDPITLILTNRLKRSTIALFFSFRQSFRFDLLFIVFNRLFQRKLDSLKVGMPIANKDWFNEAARSPPQELHFFPQKKSHREKPSKQLTLRCGGFLDSSISRFRRRKERRIQSSPTLKYSAYLLNPSNTVDWNFTRPPHIVE